MPKNRFPRDFEVPLFPKKKESKKDEKLKQNQAIVEEIEDDDDPNESNDILNDDSDPDVDMQSILSEEIKESQDKLPFISQKYLNWESWELGFPWDIEIDRVNKEVFQNKGFLNRQREIINATKAKRDVIALIPTGHGKSLTFQLSAVSDKGITIVIMPLLSLIEDQVQKLKELGIDSVFIHASNDMSDILSKLKRKLHKAKLFFVTPEQLMNNNALMDILKELYDQKQIERFVIDEIHCLLSWGKDFRNDYLKLPSIRSFFPNTWILGLTATATPKMVAELKERLLLRNPIKFSISFNRKNLFYKVIHKKKKDRKEEVRANTSIAN